MIDRLDALEGVEYSVGTRNISFDTSVTSVVTIVDAAGNNFSSTNTGKATFNDTTTNGQLTTRNISANISLTLTGCHWGLDTLGDVTDQKLWVMLIDNGANAVLGVALQGGRETVTVADAETAVGNVNSIEKVYVSTAITSENNCIYLGWIKANFDDTGNPGGENFWTIQTGVGDVNIQEIQTYFEGGDVKADRLEASENLYSGALNVGWVNNISLKAAQTSAANDSIKITSGDGSALSPTNPGWVSVHASDFTIVTYKITADITIDLTGCHWSWAGLGNVTNAILRVYAINDNDATLRWGVALQGGRQVIPSTDTSATTTSINDSEKMLVNSALTVGTWAIAEIGWFKVDFNDTGDVWTVQTGNGEICLGKADGMWQYYPAAYTGFSVNPFGGDFSWCQIGNVVFLEHRRNGGTSNSTGASMTIPIKAKQTTDMIVLVTDNGTVENFPGLARTTNGSRVMAVFKKLDETVFTNLGTKNIVATINYEAEQ